MTILLLLLLNMHTESGLAILPLRINIVNHDAHIDSIDLYE